MPLAGLEYDYDYDYDYDYVPRRKSRSAQVASINHYRPQMVKKRVYNYEMGYQGGSIALPQNEYFNIPVSIPYRERVTRDRKANDNGKSAKPKTNIKKKEKVAVAEAELTQEDTKQKLSVEKIVKRINNSILLVCGVAILFLILYRSSLINEKFNKVEKAKKELINCQTLNEQIQAEIDSETDLSYIENYARYQLGMQKPKTTQIVYINLDKKDKVLTPTVVENEEEIAWYTKIVDKIKGLF